MALYHFSIKPVSKLKGESVVKAAAYISRGKLYHEREDMVYDFSSKTDLLYSEILLPTNTPQGFSNRQVLWNEAEKAEKRYDARMGRSVVSALPNELILDEQIDMVRAFVSEAFVSLGMCADVAIHSGHHKDNQQIEDNRFAILPHNPHLHILLTDRPVDRDGFCRKKDRGWNKELHIHRWRELWENALNREFKRKGLGISVSRESLEAQGIDRKPTIHLGRTVMEMERRGKETDRAKDNREIEVTNRARAQERESRNREQSRGLDMDW